MNVQLNSFIIQKYIKMPFLIYSCKFDFRVRVMFNHTRELYFFKEGYLRLSGSEFFLDKSNPNDQFVHLTNNSIQKYLKSYGVFEDGNQMSFKDLQKSTDFFYPDKNMAFIRTVFQKWIELRIDCLLWENMLNLSKIKNSFELFGYDFVIDKDAYLWLIEEK